MKKVNVTEDETLNNKRKKEYVIKLEEKDKKSSTVDSSN